MRTTDTCAIIVRWRKEPLLWTEEEISLIRSGKTVDELCELLPHRTKKSIINKRSRILPARQKQWTMDERRILQQYYQEEGESISLRLPGRSWDSIRSQAYYLRKRGWDL